MSFSEAISLSANIRWIKRQFDFLRIDVQSVNEYFDRTKAEREWFGLYKTPFALPLEWLCSGEAGWKEFHSRIRQQYPIQYFFREWLFSLDNPVVYAFSKFLKWPLRDLKYNVRNVIKPCFPRWRKSAPRHVFTDGTHLIVESNFALILDFYYEEVINAYIDWSADETYKKFYEELVANVKWIEDERKKIEELSTEALSRSLKNKILKEGKVDYDETYTDYLRLEQHKKQKETEILKWMIDNRDFFWT